MTEKSFNQVWTTIAIVSLYTTVNSTLQSQGSELFLSFPKVESADRNAITVYGILISVPMLLFMIKLTLVYKKHFGGVTWDSRFPIALSRTLIPGMSLSRAYQRCSIFVFYVLPAILQVHLIKKFFQGAIFFNTKDCPHISQEYYTKHDGKVLAQGIWEHLTHFEPFWCTWKNGFAYASGVGVKGKVTFFSGYQSWFFLLLEIGLFVFLAYMFFQIFKKTEPKTP